jgi:hypothetical protein
MPRRQLETFGGLNTTCIYSGAVAPTVISTPGTVATGSDVLLFSGPGRFDGGFVHQNLTSGQAIFFYDGAAAVSGGPIAASGHIVLGVLNPAVSLISGAYNADRGGLIPFGTQFNSGLCVASKSGQPGFTASWTPLP